MEDEWRYLFTSSIFSHTTNPKTKYLNESCYIATWKTDSNLKIFGDWKYLWMLNILQLYHQSLSTIKPEMCEAIYKVIQKDYLKVNTYIIKQFILFRVF